MIISGFTYPVPGLSIVNARVPPAPTIEETSAPVPPPPPFPTKKVIVSIEVAPIPVVTPANGSFPPTPSVWVALVLDTSRGYGWFEKKSSLEHLNTNPPVSIPTESLVVNVWLGIVSIKLPVCDM